MDKLEVQSTHKDYHSTHPLARHQNCNNLIGYVGFNQTLFDAHLLILLLETKREKKINKIWPNIENGFLSRNLISALTEISFGMLNGFAPGISCAPAVLDRAIALITINNKNCFIFTEIKPCSLWSLKLSNKRFSTDDFNRTPLLYKFETQFFAHIFCRAIVR